MSLSLAQSSSNESSFSIFISSKLVVSLWSFESLTALVPSQVVQRMVHASLAVSIEDIFLNSSFVTAPKIAFNALLLKFAALIFTSSQSADTSFGLVQPISTDYHTFSSKDFKKALMRIFQYAQLVPSNKGGIIRDCPLSMANKGQWITQQRLNLIKVYLL